MTDQTDRVPRQGEAWKSTGPMVAIVLSVLAHLCLVIGLPGISPPQARPEPGLEVSLIRLLSSPAPPPEESAPAPDDSPEPAASRLEASVAEPEPARTESAEATQPPPESALVDDLEAEPVQQIDSQSILAAVRASIAPSQASQRDHASIPRLPDAPGWLNDHVGTVDARADQWQNPDGSSQARVVTSTGQIYCGRNDPPTMTELFNPQFSLNAMRWRTCGRERPTPVDRTDPWQRAPR